MPQLPDVPLTTDLLRGAMEVETTADGLLPHRLPAAARAQVPDEQLAMVEAQPSGVRLALWTAATTLELSTRPTKRVYVGVPPRPDGVYDVLVDGALVAQGSVPGGSALRLDLATGAQTLEVGPPGAVRFDGLGPVGGPERVVEVWLPHDETTELVALRADAPVAPAPARGRTWVHHGSSISQGSNATHPTGTWPAVAALAAGVDLVNLGFGGGAMLDPFVARAIRDLPAGGTGAGGTGGALGLVSLELGINLVNADLLRRRALGPAVDGFLDTVRDGHPDVPLLVVAPLLCPIHEDTPGPAAPDPEAWAEGRVAFRATGDPAEVAAGRLTLQVVREVLAALVARRALTDPNLSYLDGRELYGEADAAAHPLPDELHPDAETHALMGDRFAPLLRRLTV